MSNPSSVYITDEDICNEARRLFDTYPGIKSGCEQQGISRDEYVHRYALLIYRQFKTGSFFTTTGNTNTPAKPDGVYVPPSDN